MYKLYDTVKSKRNLSNDISQGTMGTILMVYEESIYEVEFINNRKETIGTLTVEEKDLIRLVM